MTEARSLTPAQLFISPMAHLQCAFFFRQLTGWWFFMLGRWKVFDAYDASGASMMVEIFRTHAAGKWVPTWALVGAGYFDMFAALTCGLMLIFGFGVRPATWILMGLLVMVVFGHQVTEPTYSLSGHVWPAAAGLVGVALLAGPRDALSVDHLIRRLMSRRAARET